MLPSMTIDVMSGVDRAGNKIAICRGTNSAEEERGRGIILPQQLENGRSRLGMRSVIEREGHLADTLRLSIDDRPPSPQ